MRVFPSVCVCVCVSVPRVWVRVCYSVRACMRVLVTACERVCEREFVRVCVC